MMKNVTRLGIISGTPGAQHEQGGRFVPHGVGRILDELLKHFPAARLCQPLAATILPHMDHCLSFKSEVIVDLPPMQSFVSAQIHRAAVSRTLHKFAHSVDVLFVRLPFQIPSAIEGLTTPKVVQIVGNPQEVIRHSTDYRGIMRWLARRFARHLEKSLVRIVAEPATRAVTNGEEMWRRLNCVHGRVVVSSSLFECEMLPRVDLKLPSVPRLLFVGYLRPEKGAETLIDAFEILRRKRAISLTIVGGVDRANTKADRKMRKRIAQSPFTTDIHEVGLLSFGKSLFDIYRNHDLFVLPSLSEGTPRTLIEARAFGCPVVATNVGGIPSSVTDGHDGILVPPNNPIKLSAAIERILDDDSLRLAIIAAGIERARRHSLENFVGEIADEIRFVSERHSESPTATFK